MILVLRNNEPVGLYDNVHRLRELTPKDLFVLKTLTDIPGKLWKRSEILDCVWPDATPEENSVDGAISRIRKAMGSDNRRLVETIFGRGRRIGGYRYVGKMAEHESESMPRRLHRLKRQGRVAKPTTEIGVDGPVATVQQLAIAQIVVPAPGEPANSEESTPVPASVTDALQDTPPADQIAPGDRTRTTPPRARSRKKLIALVGVSAALILVGVLVRRRNKPHLSIPGGPTTVVRQTRPILSPMVTDGTHLYFPECISERYQLAQVSVTASNADARPLSTSVNNPDLCDISPDGSMLLVREVPRFVTDESPFYVQPTDGHPARRLGTVRGLDGTWSRDATKIYYGNKDKIYVADGQGLHSEVFLDGLGGRAFWLRWSPDGKILRFSLIEGPKNSLWEFQAGMQRPRRLSWENDQGDFRCCGNWSREGNYYFYQARVKGLFQIWAHHEPDGQFVPLLQHVDSYRGPVSSRDGATLFARAETLGAELRRLDPGTHAITSLLSDFSISMADVSPDEKRIAYTTFPARVLFVSDADGSQQRQLTDASLDPAMPIWSPQGDRIAFMAHADKHWQTFTVSATGSDLEPILPGDPHDTRDPTWSRTGKYLLVGYGPTILDKPESTVIIKIDLATHKRTMIPGSRGLFSPRWSPDERYIAALSYDAQRLLLYHNGVWQEVAAEKKLGYPNWSHDGQFLYFLDATGSTNLIKRIRLQKHRTETVADLGGYHQPCTIFGNWLGIAKDAPLFIHDKSTHFIGSFAAPTP